MNDCIQCAQFDKTTKEQMNMVFGQDELMFHAFLLAAYIKSMREMSRSVDEKKKMIAKAQGDFATACTGKFFTAMDPLPREKVLKKIQDDMKLILNLNDEACPHHPQGAA